MVKFADSFCTKKIFLLGKQQNYSSALFYQGEVTGNDDA